MAVEKIRALIRQGNAFILNRDYKNALSCAKKIIRRDKNNADAHYMAASCLMNLGMLDEAANEAIWLLKRYPEYIGGYVVLAYVYKKKQQYVSQIKILEAALIKLRPDDILAAEVYSLLGSVNTLLGNADQAAQYFYQASRCENSTELAIVEYSNYLLASNYIFNISEADLYERHAGYNKFFENIKRYQHKFRWREKIKIGYISSDFRYHAVSYFSLSFFRQAAREKFEIYCYADIQQGDEVTEEFRKDADYWRDITGCRDSKIAEIVYNDKIDILVDLGGHTAGNHLSVLAYRPAPIQICGIGYFHSTGLAGVDYFLGDSYCDTAAENELFFSEQVLHLAQSHWCYQPLKPMPDAAVKPPCWQNGYITFCSFNNFNKISDNVLEIWSRILNGVPNSRLILKSEIFSSEEGLSHIRKRCAESGLPLDRLEFRGISKSYLLEYNEADIALDTFPYTGGATTCEALYMGVPVITLAGRRHGSRFGVSMLSNIGCRELIAASVEEYIQKAINLAKDKQKINYYKTGLRHMMEQSPLMNQQEYIRSLELKYEEIFCRWQGNNLQAAGTEVERLAEVGSYLAAFNLCIEILQYVVKHGDRQQQMLVWSRTAELSRILGDGKMAFEAYYNALQCSDAADANMYESMLLCLHYNHFDRSVAAKLHKSFIQLMPYRNKFSLRQGNHKNRLKIGYISADFKKHVMLNFIAVFLTSFNEEQFEIYCYMTGQEDEYTQKLKKQAIIWKNISNLPAEDAAAVIYQDSLDILVDFNGHSRGSNLAVMSFRPAPIQISGLGYIDLLGLPYIDYILADNEQYKVSETCMFDDKLLVLNNLFCYRPYQTENIAEIPAFIRRGYITFGSFNALAKLNEDVLSAWAQIIKQVPGSVLLLKSDAFADEYFCREYKIKLNRLGIERCDLRATSRDYLGEYNDIDIALDPFPYNGGGTTCEALYMGVPVISLRGGYFGACYGASILEAAGLGELVTDDVNQYISLAVELAANKESLSVLKHNLRAHIKSAPLMNQQAYMHSVEEKYKDICKNHL